MVESKFSRNVHLMSYPAVGHDIRGDTNPVVLAGGVRFLPPWGTMLGVTPTVCTGRWG
jgi:hypothetical protein